VRGYDERRDEPVPVFEGTKEPPGLLRIRTLLSAGVADLQVEEGQLIIELQE
jgi:hypothetical protein